VLFGRVVTSGVVETKQDKIPRCIGCSSFLLTSKLVASTARAGEAELQLERLGSSVVAYSCRYVDGREEDLDRSSSQNLVTVTLASLNRRGALDGSIGKRDANFFFVSE
jgi:hypothetical protein